MTGSLGKERDDLAEEQAALRRVATLVARGAPPDELFASVTEEAAQLLPVDFAGLGRCESDDTMVSLAARRANGDTDVAGAISIVVDPSRSAGARDDCRDVFPAKGKAGPRVEQGTAGTSELLDPLLHQREAASPPPGSRYPGPFTDAARCAVYEWITCRYFLGPDHVWPWLNLHPESTMSDPMTRHTFDKLLPTYIGLGWTLKRLRDTCAAAWVRSHMPLAHLQQLLGLTSIEATLPYARLVRGSLDGSMEKLDTIFTDFVQPGDIAA